MLKNFRFLIAIAILILSQQSAGQNNTVDSLTTLIKKAEDSKKAELNLELAKYYLSENPDSSIKYSQIAKNQAQQTNDHKIVIRSYAMIGEAYQKQNKIKEGIASYLKGLEISEKHNEKSLSGTLYNGIGTCYFYLNNLKKAEYYLKLAAKSKKEANDYKYYAFISANIAAIQIANQSFGESIKTLKEAEKTLLKDKQYESIATIYNSLGAAYQSVKPDSCIYYYEKSLSFSAKNKDYLNMMSVYQNIGDYYLSKKNYPKAMQYMKNAIATNELRPEDEYKARLFERISGLYDSIKDFKNAYHYKKLEVETRQRLLSKAKQKEIEELEIKYQTAKKEKQIQQHKHEIEKAKNQQIMLIFSSIALFLIAGIITYILFQRKKLSQKLEQEKLKLFENIVHEIKTPLTLIDGPIQVMKQNPDLSYQQELGLMERNSKKLMNLVDELLDTSKLKKGSFQLHYTTGPIDDFIETIVSNFMNEAKAKEIEIVNIPSNTEKSHSFPSNALEKIVSNLIGNAIKYCPEKSKIEVISQINGTQLSIKVNDNGNGIPKAEQKQVFQRFFRGKGTSHLNGTGIGLSLVKELVELAQGTVELQSNADGTAFLVSVPIKEMEVNAHPVQNENNPILLLAEDDPDTAAFSISMLKDSFQVIHAINGKHAIDLINENLPDIVLSDVMMPGKDGVELLHEIRSNELTNHLPVVLFSAKASIESRLQGLQNGADAYISKPFSPEELKLTITNIFATVQRNRESYKESVQSEKTFEERIKSENAYVNKVVENVIRNIDNNEYSVNELSSDMNVSRSQLHRKLVSLTGFSTTAFISMIRLEKAKDLLTNNEGNITEIAYKCGFSSQSYFTKSFTEYFQKSPSQFLKGQ
ncbi:MAG: ATP-binding protein [Flavobacterium sp.]